MFSHIWCVECGFVSHLSQPSNGSLGRKCCLPSSCFTTHFGTIVLLVLNFSFLTRRRKAEYILLDRSGKHVCTCTSTHSPSSARSLSPSNRPQNVFQERRLNGDAPMVSLVQPAGLDFLWGCSLAQLCIWKLYMPFGYFEFEEVYAGIHWSNFRRVIWEISALLCVSVWNSC